MDLLNNFYVDGDSRIRLNKRVIVVRDYKTTERTDYDEHTYYVNDESYREWTEQLIPKHQLNELISDEQLDTSAVAWMDGIELRTDNHPKEIAQIAAYGSMEAYTASLDESRDEYLLDLDCRISAVELGI